MANKFSFVDNRKKVEILFTLNKIIQKYNSYLYKYTKSWLGKIPNCKTDVDKIPKNFITINEYLKSKKIWSQILSFIANTEIKDFDDYFDTMIRNWNEITLSINKINLKRPLPNMIFSEKMINFYYNFKKSEDVAKSHNTNLLLNKDDGFYLLEKTMQQDINNLFKLKKINTELSFHDIIIIFGGEFDDRFKDVVLNIPEENIDVENITKLFS